MLQSRQRIIVADDEQDMLDLVCRALDREGFEVRAVLDGEQAWKTICCQLPDLIIVDWMMPRMSGLDVCRNTRADPKTAHIPVVMLSARVEEVDRIVAFELGVDDFVAKPFSPRELTLRVKAILRTASPVVQGKRKLTFGSIVIDEEMRRVTGQSGEIRLSAVEYRLLFHFFLHPNHVHSRQDLRELVWEGSEVELRTIDTVVRRLRARLEGTGVQIETVRVFGYRLSST